MNEHIQIRHLTVIDIRVQLLQPAALDGQHIDPGGGQGCDHIVPLLKLDNALRQRNVGPGLPLRIDLSILVQGTQAPKHQCFYGMPP